MEWTFSILTIKASQISADFAMKYELAEDTYDGEPSWWKVVMMNHGSCDLLAPFFTELKAQSSLS